MINKLAASDAYRIITGILLCLPIVVTREVYLGLIWIVCGSRKARYQRRDMVRLW